MWRRIEQKILQINKAAGIEIILLDEDRYIIQADVVSTKGNSIIKEMTIHGLKQLNDLEEKIDPAIPLSVVINGKGVLIKKIPAPAGDNIIQSVLPNANPNDFYVERLTGRHTEIISIVRKETADRIIDQLKRSGFKVIAFSPGFNALRNILPFLKPGHQQQLESDSLLMEIDDQNEVANFTYKEHINNNRYQASEYLLADQYIQPANILSFSAATGLLADDIKSSSPINAQALAADRNEYRFYKLFKAAGWALLVFTLSLLLVNFFIYNTYFSKNRSITASRAFSVQQQQKFATLEAEVHRKEKFLESSGWNGSSRTSFYADRIAALVPGDMLLSSMQIGPLRNNTLTGPGDMLFKKDTILVTGTCDDPVQLDQFVNSLKILPHFKEVTIKNYTVRNEQERGAFSMEIITQ